MPKDDYTAVAGGRLKLKGVSDARVDKKKKKKSKDKSTSSKATTSSSASHDKAPQDPEEIDNNDKSLEKSEKKKEKETEEDSKGGSGEEAFYIGKTEAQIRFEERKRRRLDERLMKEGGKSHKERVEEFNRYLANLSEHHDMYVFLFISPSGSGSIHVVWMGC